MGRAVILLCLGFVAATANAAVEVTSHAYVHNPSGQTRIVLHLASYKRGLFFGSCGPSTRSLQWEYSIELKGEGPEYAKQDIDVSDGNLQVLTLESGRIRLESGKHSAAIALRIKDASGVHPFPGNGEFKIRLKR